jgi:uncharacterized membrane protein
MGWSFVLCSGAVRLTCELLLHQQRSERSSCIDDDQNQLTLSSELSVKQVAEKLRKEEIEAPAEPVAPALLLLRCRHCNRTYKSKLNSPKTDQSIKLFIIHYETNYQAVFFSLPRSFQ